MIRHILLDKIFKDEEENLNISKNLLKEYKEILPLIGPEIWYYKDKTRERVRICLQSVDDLGVVDEKGNVILPEGIASALLTIKRCGIEKDFESDLHEKIFSRIVLPDNYWADHNTIDMESWNPIDLNKVEVIGLLTKIYEEVLSEAIEFSSLRIHTTILFFNFVNRLINREGNNGLNSSIRILNKNLDRDYQKGYTRRDLINPKIIETINRVFEMEQHVRDHNID